MRTDSLFSALLSAEGGGHGAVEWWAPVVWGLVVFSAVMTLLLLSLPGAKRNVPQSPLTRLAEHVYLFIESMCVGVIGPHGRSFVPLVFTIYLIILFSNLLGLFGFYAPTSSLGITFGMAIMVVAYVQYVGIRQLGFKGYVKHFLGPDLGLPWFIGVWITLLLFVIEVVSELAKNLSLSLRLQGNISGEHRVAETFGSLVPVSETFAVPLQAVLFPLGVFVSLVQALVFTMLTCVYLSLFTHQEAEEKHAH